MIISKKGISFPLLLFPFVLILVLFFSIQIIGEKESIINEYGSSANEIHSLNNQRFAYEHIYDGGFKELYYQVASVQLNERFNNCRGGDTKIKLYDEFNGGVSSCIENLEDNGFIMETFRDKIDQYIRRIQRGQESVDTTVEKQDGVISVEVESLLEKETTQIGVVKNTTYTQEFHEISYDEFKTLFTNPQTIENYVAQLKQCRTNAQNYQQCQKDLTKQLFSIEDIPLNIKQQQISQGEMISLLYTLYNGVEFEIVMIVDMK